MKILNYTTDRRAEECANEPSGAVHHLPCSRRKTINRLSIIIVNWRSADYLVKCLASVFRESLPTPTEVIVIDNASFDGCANLIRQTFPNTVFLQSDENLGFAGANNRAFAASSGDYVLFLNPDTEVRNDAIARLLAVLDSDSSIGAVGGRLLESDLSLQMRSILPFPTILNQVLDIGLLKRVIPRFRLWRMAPMYDRSPHPVDVEAVCGACIMVRSDVFEGIGMFSTDYFMFAEDVDLCTRILRSRKRVCYFDGAEIVHRGGVSCARQEKSACTEGLMRESVTRLMARFRSASYACSYRKAMAIASIVRLLLLVGGAPLMILFGNIGGLRLKIAKWWTVFAWACGRRIWPTRRSVMLFRHCHDDDVEDGRSISRP